jgi:large repetitive protein
MGWRLFAIGLTAAAMPLAACLGENSSATSTDGSASEAGVPDTGAQPGPGPGPGPADGDAPQGDAQAAVDASTCLSNGPGLVSWWTADGTFADTLGANNGSQTGTVDFAQGHVGQAFDISNSNFVEVKDSNSLDLAKGFTIEAWIKSNGGDGRIVSKVSNGGASGYLVDLAHGGRLRVLFLDGAHTLEDPLPVPTQKFVHVAATYDGAKMTIYVDGVERGAKSATGELMTNTLPLRIGADSAGASPFPGLIDEVAIYTQALGAADIAAIAKSPTGRCR